MEIKKVSVRATKSKNFNNYSIEFEANIGKDETVTQVAEKLKERCNWFVNKWIGEIKEPSNTSNPDLEHLDFEVPPTKVITTHNITEEVVIAVSNKGLTTKKIDVMIENEKGEESEGA